jgi:N-acetylglutamate synthase
VVDARDVGHRVVVRRYVGIDDRGRQIFTDMLGELIVFGADGLVILGDDGVERVVPSVEVAAAKRVPPRPVKYSEIASLELIADRAWSAPMRDQLGGWLLRSAEGWTNRANSALPLGDSGVSIDEAISFCERWYALQDLPPKITVPLPLRRDVAKALVAHGWFEQPTVLVQVATLAPTEPTHPVDLHPEPTEAFLEIVTARKESLPASAHHVLTTAEHVRFAEVRQGGDLVAIARGAVIAGWMHLGLVEVRESARRQGLARAASQALMQWAVPLGATRAVLQVEEENEPAVGLYAAMGFTTHHRYNTYRAPDA